MDNTSENDADTLTQDQTDPPELKPDDQTGTDLDDSVVPTDTKPTDESCVPQCQGRECGDDGCGGSCGTCPAAAPQCKEGICSVVCTPSCDGKECGDDGCGGVCGKCPAAAPYCKSNMCAVECEADCVDRQCGDDGCGTPCGLCPQGWSCEEGICACQPLCANKECGNDSCGGLCGECPADAPFCVSGKCAEDCTPHCEGMECGDDGCGGDCGTCSGENTQCIDGFCICIPECAEGSCGPDGCGGQCPSCPCGQTCQEGVCTGSACDGLQCGPDACGGSCGECPAGYECSGFGLCLDSCDLACVGKECGNDGCGGVCGVCPEGGICSDLGVCLEVCLPDCTGLECGADGCGGSCGTCGGATPFCNDGHCEETCQPACGIAVCGDDGCGGQCGVCQNDLNCTLGGSCGGLCSQCHFEAECYDITFADGNLGMWSISEAEVVTNLGVTQAPTDGHMLLLTTAAQADVEEQGAMATIQNCLPGGSYMMLISWKLLSEEFKEYCGSKFQDSFTIEITPLSGNATTVAYTIDNLCEASSCPGCGTHYNELVQTDVTLDQGDAWATGWFEDSIPFVLEGAQAGFAVTLKAQDAGDGLFDTVVLVDRIRFLSCANACDTLECGPNPCGGSCGSCPNGLSCVSGVCCHPDCEGKECGDDGCGGSCGLCGADSMCSEGVCLCKNVVCLDGCCSEGEMCGVSSGKCCLPQCTQACGANGCGGICPPPAGGTCCSVTAECDDEDACTIDACLLGVCQHTPSASPECCTEYQYIQNFDTGSAPEFSIANSDGGFGIGGWSVTNQCGSHTAEYSLYFGYVTSPMGGATCTYSSFFPIPMPMSGTATTSAMALPLSPLLLTFWVYADVVADPAQDVFEVRVLEGSNATVVWSKGDLAGGVGASWKQAAVDLAAFAGKSVQLQFSFNTQSSSDTTKSGPRIDDIQIQSLCP